MEKEIVSASDLGEMFGVSRYTVRRMVERNEITVDYRSKHNEIFWTPENAKAIAKAQKKLRN